jgi:predicted  nucleic acid-binding Zn-ribbon protein
MSSEGDIVEHVAVRVQELEEHLDRFSERLRAIRQRNRDLENDLSVFEDEIDRLRAWLREQREGE